MIAQGGMPPYRMLIGHDRIFYHGLQGRYVKDCRLGAFVIYLAPMAAEGNRLEVRVADGPWRRLAALAVAPLVPHQVRSAGNVCKVLIEPETVTSEVMESLVSRLNAPGTDPALLARIETARRALVASYDADGFETAAFDRLLLGEHLPSRDLDWRIARIVKLIDDELREGCVTAETYAESIGLSTSRFLHLFKETTGMSFRALKAWKRARRFLDYANRRGSLTDVALDLGYPDSSHFSRSIRSSYGLKPRAIRNGSTALQVCFGADYRQFCGLA